jgi:hypothetical protein
MNWKQRIANLLSVKSLVTVIMTMLLAAMILAKIEPPKELLMLYSTTYGAIITYFFTKQEDK